MTTQDKLADALRVFLRDYEMTHGTGDLEMQPALYQARKALAARLKAAQEPVAWRFWMPPDEGSTEWVSSRWYGYPDETIEVHKRIGQRIEYAYTAPQPLALPEVPEGFYLASFKGPLRDEVLWWGENDRGYTTDLSEAGVYTEIKPNYHDSEHTVPVPVAFVGAQHTRRVLSRAYQGNTSWRSADTLRKEIESYRARLMAKAVPND